VNYLNEGRRRAKAIHSNGWCSLLSSYIGNLLKKFGATLRSHHTTYRCYCADRWRDTGQTKGKRFSSRIRMLMRAQVYGHNLSGSVKHWRLGLRERENDNRIGPKTSVINQINTPKKPLRDRHVSNRFSDCSAHILENVIYPILKQFYPENDFLCTTHWHNFIPVACSAAKMMAISQQRSRSSDIVIGIQQKKRDLSLPRKSSKATVIRERPVSIIDMFTYFALNPLWIVWFLERGRVTRRVLEEYSKTNH
jgi:hypothetical protein